MLFAPLFLYKQPILPSRVGDLQSGFCKGRAEGIVNDNDQDRGGNGVYEGGCGAPFRQDGSHLLGLAENVLFVEVANQRIEDHVEAQACDGGDKAPLEDVFLVGALADVSDLVGNQAGDEADAELQDEGFGCAGDVNRIHQVSDGHADSSGQSAVAAAEKQGCQDAEGISQMQGSGISAGHGNLDLQEGKDNIAQSGEESCQG